MFTYRQLCAKILPAVELLKSGPAESKPSSPMLPKSFSVRTLLSLITLICVALAIWHHRAMQQQRLVQALLDAGARVTYEHEVDANGRPVTSPPGWLLRLLGPDYLYGVWGVGFYPEPPQEADELIKLLDEMPGVKRVAIWPGGKGRTSSPTLDGGLTDKGLFHLLSKHPKLVHLSLLHAKLSLAGISALDHHPALASQFKVAGD